MVERMADQFKKYLHKNVGVGGIFCHCCNDYFGNDREKLNRLARHQLKQETKKEIEEELESCIALTGFGGNIEQ